MVIPGAQPRLGSLWILWRLLFVRCLILTALASSVGTTVSDRIRPLSNSGSFRNNWVVILDTSRFYTNYRHASNALSIYMSARRLGVPDSQIILLLADDVACNPRNPAPGTIVGQQTQRKNLYPPDIQVDFRGTEVTVDTVRRLLTGRQSPWTPRNKRLMSDGDSHVFVYITGHGGDGFLKFHDFEEITSEELADAVFQMHLQKRYKRLVFVADTCQAGTLFKHLYTPNVVAIGCSQKSQNSYSHHSDPLLGTFVMDRFTHYAIQYLNGLSFQSDDSFSQLLATLTPEKLGSSIDVRTLLVNATLDDLPVVSFLGTFFSSDYPVFLNDRNSEEADDDSGFPLKDLQ